MKKKILIHLRPLVFKAKIEGTLKQSILQELEQLLRENTEMFKMEKMKMLDVDILSEFEIRPGMIVRTIHDEIGIITKITDEDKPITVVLPGHRLWNFEASELRKAANVGFEEARCIRLEFAFENDLWHEGDSGYIALKNVNGPIPVVIGATSKGITLVHPIYANEAVPNTINIPTLQLSQYVKEFLDGESREDYPSPDEIIGTVRDNAIYKTKTKTEQIKMMNNKRLELLKLIKSKKAKPNKYDYSNHNSISKMNADSRELSAIGH